MAQKTGSGIFKRKKTPPPPPTPRGMVNTGARIRLVEEKINNLNRKVELLESAVLDNYKKNSKDMKILDDEFVSLKRSINTMQQKMDFIIKELKMSAGKEEVRAIQKYLDLWNPVKFATREELDEQIANITEKTK